MTVRHLGDMTRDEAAAAAGVLVVPIASTEQHGPHLPLATDEITLGIVLDRALVLIDPAVDVIVAPTLSFGSSDHHLPYSGTISLGSETYLAVLKDVLQSLVRGGFGRILLLNGHGGNLELAELAARDVAQTAEPPVTIAAASWWAIARASLEELGAPPVGHAGAFETGLLRAVRPELVRPSPRRAAPANEPVLGGTRIERTGWWVERDGYTDDPEGWDRVAASACLDAAAADVATLLTQFAAAELA